MAQRYRKECTECQQAFENKATGGCPFCGSINWRFVDEREYATLLEFVIEGNQEDPKGNPIPYLRLTQNEMKLLHIPDHKMASASGARKKRAVKRYFDWKSYVKETCLYQSTLDGKKAEVYAVKMMLAENGKMQFDCKIFFKNRKHADPENIRKGVQDSLFTNDKLVMGSVDFDYDPKRPRVEVEIAKP